MNKSKRGICAAWAAICALSLLAVGEKGISGRAYTATQEYPARLLLAPSVVTEAESAAAYEEIFTAENKPKSVVLGVSGDGLTAADGTAVGGLSETFSELAEHSILPIVKLESVYQATLLADLQGAEELSDFALTGSDVNSLKQAKELFPYARVYVDFSEESPYADAYDYIKECRSAGGNVAILSERQADWETVYYLQSMMTTVWVRAEDESEVGFADLIASGAYGIVAEDYEALYKLYDDYPVYALSRSYYNIGHRGLPYVVNENSLEGCIAAYEAGATHLEIDVQATADGRLAVMHDATIDRTTNGTGAVKEMTMAELRRFKIVRTMNNELTGEESEIPSLDDMFAYFKGKDVVLVIEIKDSNADTCRLIKECIEEYGVERQCVAISFYDWAGSQIERMHELMPELPVASLQEVTAKNFDEYLRKAALWNMTFDSPYTEGYSGFVNSNFKDRGYMAWLWTYDNPSAAELGISGITNNRADMFGKRAKRLFADGELTLKAEEDISAARFTVKKQTFGGAEEEVEAGVFVYEKTDGGYRAVLFYEDRDDEYYSSVKIYTREVFVREKAADRQSEEGSFAAGGCGSVFALRGAVFGVVLLTMFAIKKNAAKNGRKNKNERS